MKCPHCHAELDEVNISREIQDEGEASINDDGEITCFDDGDSSVTDVWYRCPVCYEDLDADLFSDPCDLLQ